MSGSFIVYAGRAWPPDQNVDGIREVGRFSSLEEAQRAFRPVTFIQLPTLNGSVRWRGMSPKSGLIVQIEQALPASGPDAVQHRQAGA